VRLERSPLYKCLAMILPAVTQVVRCTRVPLANYAIGTVKPTGKNSHIGSRT
jgi:hypothetical protein